MATTRALLREYFAPLATVPCWNATAEFGSWLSFRFGEPHLEIREGNPDSKLKSLRRRAVFVEGEFFLWVEMGAWQLFESGKLLFHSEQARKYLRRAAGHLDSQKLSRVELATDPTRTVFAFENGSELRVCPTMDSEPDEPLWHVYGAGKCLSLLADGTFEHGASQSQRPHRTTARAAVHVA